MLTGEVGIESSSSFLTWFSLRTKLYVGLGDPVSQVQQGLGWCGLGLNLMHHPTGSPFLRIQAMGKQATEGPLQPALLVRLWEVG